MFFDVYNMSDKTCLSLLPIYSCPNEEFFCNSWMPEPKSDFPGQLGNLIVTACLQVQVAFQVKLKDNDTA